MRDYHFVPLFQVNSHMPETSSSKLKKIPVSVFIISLDEADRIETAIASVIDWVEEVVVVDSGSTDGTIELAKAAGARVYHHDWPGYGLQKRYGEDLCKNNWLLNIDADEEITPALRNEIISLFSTKPDADIYKIKIVDLYPHENEAKRWAYGYWQFRLYDRHHGRFSDSPVHDTVRPEAQARLKSLEGRVNHRSMRCIHWSIAKMNRYSDMQCDDWIARGRKLSAWRLIVEFPFSFMKSYFLRQQFRYGYWGLVIAHNYAFSRFLRLAKIYEASLVQNGKPAQKSDDE